MTDVRLEDLRRCLITAFDRLGVPAEHGRAIAEVFLDCELRGHEDHGVFMFGNVVNAFRRPGGPPAMQATVVAETEQSLVLVGNSFSVVAATQAMRWCIERARERRGIAMATVRGSNFIAAAPYVRLAADAGLIGFACNNSNALVPPPGGASPALGTNPLGFGCPAGRHPPIVLDMATSAVAGLTVAIAKLNGQPAPEAAVLDSTGQSTTDAASFLGGGMLASLGYPTAPYKGFGLALMVEILAGVLAGPGVGRNVSPLGTEQPGSFFLAIDPEAFLPRTEFLARVDALLDQIKSGDRLEGVAELFFPGERGQRRSDTITASGIVPLSRVALGALETVCRALDLEVPKAVEG